mmetsp:Transcript_10176/g.10300  ORF Transcript_10176/g.10300 Transcript_10176/m.10300 type:complete len:96 (-) Transcript_10176:200-487(-)
MLLALKDLLPTIIDLTGGASCNSEATVEPFSFSILIQKYVTGRITKKEKRNNIIGRVCMLFSSFVCPDGVGLGSGSSLPDPREMNAGTIGDMVGS